MRNLAAPYCFFAVLFGVLFVTTAAFVQMNTAGVTGSVTDPTGAVVFGANVAAAQVATQQAHISTNDAGQYSLAQLSLGEYKLTVDATESWDAPGTVCGNQECDPA
jgi:hypothetical protein